MKNQIKRKPATKAVIWIIMFLLCLNMTFALGIRPVKTEVGSLQSYQGSFKVVNNDHKDLKLRIYVEGDLKDYIELPQTELEFTSTEEIKTVPFTLEIPERELPPGRIEGRIIVEEELYKAPTSDGYVAANIKMAHKVYVDVPYPEKYIEAKIDVEEKEEGVDLIATVKNLGTTDLDEVKSTLSVYSGTEEIASYDNPAEQLDVMEEHSFRNYVEKEKLGQGEFKVLSSIEYAEYTLELIEAFMIGEPIIKLLNYDKYFEVGRINELALELKSEWNTLISNIHAEVFVFKDNKEVFNTKTTSFELEPYEEKKVVAHLDARNLELGEYDINVVLSYLNQSIVETYEAHLLSEEDYRKMMQGLSPLVYILIAVIVVVIAIAVLLGYFVFSMKRKSKTLNTRKRKIKNK